MQTIFVFIKCALGASYKVADDLVQTVDEVSEVFSISGQHDLLVKVYLPPDSDIGRFVNERIQRIDGIRDTFTLIAFKAFA